MKNSTIALVAAGVIATAGLGYIVYFDSKRRSDPNFRKQLSKILKDSRPIYKSITCLLSSST